MASKKKNKQIKPKTKKAICILSAILFFVFLFISLLLMINIFKLNMLPFKIVLPIMLVDITLIVLFAIFSLKQKIKWKIKVVCDIFMVILSICLFFANHYIDRTISFFKTVTDNNYEVENYYVLVLKDSKLKNKDDLLDKKVGFVDKLGTTNEALDKLKEEVTFENVNIKSIFELGNALLDKDVDAILMADYHKAILDEQIEKFDSQVRILYQFTIKKETQVESTSVDITKDAFNIYLSGIDTYGDIDSIARSDVNMVITVNPTTHQILLTSIPRDYYVELSCYNAKDKLTHAGMYGIDCSIGTIENFLDVDINYYARVNFSSVINLVDVLGGINVYSEFTFNTYGYQFYKGYNNVNGAYALAFSRARYNFEDGDRQRIKNQQAVIRAIVDKLLSPAILSKYTDILEALKNSFQTNLSVSEIQKLAKYQIDKMPKWEISSISLNGSDSENYTYSFGSQLLYVMEPDISTVTYAHEMIDKIINGEETDLNSTTTNPQSTNSNVPVTPPTTTTTTTTTTTMTTTRPNNHDNNSSSQLETDNGDNSNDVENDKNDDFNNNEDETIDTNNNIDNDNDTNENEETNELNENNEITSTN